MQNQTIDFLDYKSKGQLFAMWMRFQKHGNEDAALVSSETRFARMRNVKGFERKTA